MEKLESKMEQLGIELKNVSTLLQQVLDRWDKRDDDMYFEVKKLKVIVKKLENDRTKPSN